MHSFGFLGPVFCYFCIWRSWAVLLLMSFCRSWEEGMGGVGVFNLVFLLFEEESLKILIFNLHILYRSLYTSSGTEGGCFGRVVFTDHWERQKGIYQGPVFFVYRYNNIALIFTHLRFSAVSMIFIYVSYLLPGELYSHMRNSIVLLLSRLRLCLCSPLLHTFYRDVVCAVIFWLVLAMWFGFTEPYSRFV